MGKSVSFITLASAIGFALLGAGLQSSANARTANLQGSAPVDLSQSGSATGIQSYIITFAEEGVLNYKGGVSGMQSTAPLTTDGSRKLDVNTHAARTYTAYLAGQRASHVQAIDSALNRAVSATHSYAVTVNGIAANLSASEAAKVAVLPGVASVRLAGEQYLDTHRSAAFIGADKIWDGSATPSHSAAGATKGKGILVADLDGGTNSGHPSFANDPACGFRASQPKLIAADCSTTDANGFCNGPNIEANPGFGHGVHTSSTIVGNIIDNTASPAPTLPDGVTMSGIAPCAAIRHYKVCATNTCDGAAIYAGIQNAIADQADVLNFSISGGTSPWGDNDRDFLDAVNADVFVAASAGNTRTETPDPVGQVNHLGPWVMTVAASTQDQLIGPQMSVTGPGSVPPALVNFALNPGSTTSTGNTNDLVGRTILSYPTNLEGCTAAGNTYPGGGFPAGYFNDAIAVVRRGTCPFTEKITNAYNAGAKLVVIANNQAGSINMDTTGTPAVPAFSILQSAGNPLVAFLAPLAPPAPAAESIFVDGFDGPRPAVGGGQANYNRVQLSATQGDVLADFSLRGPARAPAADSTKPDITAPGVNIYAALDVEDGNYGFMSGTSMSSPNTAGAAVLVRAVHPDWTAPEVKSAMMMTATNANGRQEDGTTAWTVDQVGSGRVDLTRATLAGLTMDETFAKFLAANPAATPPGDVKTLNLPLLRNVSCPDTGCTWTRTVKNRLATPSTWNVTSATASSFAVTATPATFTLAPGATQAITFTATPAAPPITALAFGNLTLTEASGLSPALHITVAVQSGVVAPPAPTVVCTGGNCTFQVDAMTSSISGLGCASYCGMIWLNRYTPNPSDYPITITSVTTIFGSGAGWNQAGDKISVFVYQDADSDPTNGATAAGTPTVYTMGTPVNAFVTIPLNPPVTVNGPGEVLIALSNPNAANVGSRPATMDGNGAFMNRSYIGDSVGDGTVAPDLPDTGLEINPATFQKNWVLRATGTNGSGTPIVLGLDAGTSGQ